MSTPESNPVRFNAETVLREIYCRRNARYVIWSPRTTLRRLGIDRVEFNPQNTRRMRKILQQLCDDGHLIQRSELHNDESGMNEIAYSRIPNHQLRD